MSEAVLYELRGDAAWITLNRPERRNALSAELLEGLLASVRRAQADDGARAVVLTGAGTAFCAGADLSSGGMQSGADDNPFVALLKTIWEFPKPVIARVNGAAFGGGVGLVAACDIAVAADSVTFSFSEVRLGVVPAMISVVVLPKIGISHSMWLFLTGERFGAARAVEIGLLQRALPAAELDAGIEQIVGMLRLGGPIALREAKQLVRRIPEMATDKALLWAADKVAGLFASPEAAEGMQAFLEKRPPSWAKGR